MLFSMTGYANKTIQLSNFSLQIDIKSVNHRYFDLTIKSPEEFKTHEQYIREIIAKKIVRGKMELRIHLKESANSTTTINLNHEIFAQYQNLERSMLEQNPQARPLSIAEILRLPSVLNQNTYPVEEIQQILIAEIPQLITELNLSQSREGEKLSEIINEKLVQIKKLIDIAKLELPNLIQAYQIKLRTKLQEALGDATLNEQRLQQEFAYFCQKIDVIEEIERLNAHVAEFIDLLKHGGAIGKKLDFISQEMHREANTFGAKSVALETSKISIELKVLIEQIREQIQNIM